MTTATVNRETLQKLIDYMWQDESKDFEEYRAMEWTEEELEKHVFSLLVELQNFLDAQP